MPIARQGSGCQELATTGKGFEAWAPFRFVLPRMGSTAARHECRRARARVGEYGMRGTCGGGKYEEEYCQRTIHVKA
jgi:hypothetical protein